jgi:hypothetical protein
MISQKHQAEMQLREWTIASTTNKPLPSKPSWRRPLLVGVKAVHSLIYFSIEFCVSYLIYAGLKGREDKRTAIAAGVVAAESLIFVGNRCRCPLTGLAKNFGAASGSVTDIYLPSFLASNLVPIHVPLLALAVGLHARNFLRRPGAKVHSCAREVYMKPVYIPESHRGLIDGGSCVALTTVMPDGQPQSLFEKYPVMCYG